MKIEVIKKWIGCLCFVCCFIQMPAVRAVETTPLVVVPSKWVPHTLMATSIALNLPYACYLIRSRDPIADLKSRLFYRGDIKHALVNHMLNGISMGCLWLVLSVKQCTLVPIALFGLQTSMYAIGDAYGVSLIWSGLTGVALCNVLFSKEKQRFYAYIPLVFNGLALVYYGCTAPLRTNVAHLGGMAFGFALAVPLLRLR